MEDDALAAALELLQTLWRLHDERPGKPCSLARLSKQAGLPMSALRRQLLPLAEAGWVVLQLEEGGVAGTVALSVAGQELCRALH